MKYTFCFILFLSAAFAFNLYAEPRYDVKYSSVPPVMDGDVDLDPVWKEYPWTTSQFVSFKKGDAAKVNTRFKAIYTDDAVYIAFECLESEVGRMTPEEREGEYWTFDCIELFLFPASGEMIHPMVTAGGGMHDEIPALVIKRTGNKAAWLAAAKKYSDRWTCEFCLPFYLIGKGPGLKEAYELPFNVSRYATPTKQYSTWSFQPAGLKDSGDFGRLVLMPVGDPAAAERVASALKTPHYLSLAKFWKSIMTDAKWARILEKNKGMADEIEALYAAGATDTKKTAEFAAKLAKLEKIAEDSDSAELSRMKKRFFDE